ncbi:MAG: arylesterase [Bradyrhizobiaceae bacterium]|nr:arylesterase [Bradyrhizobiaceae bacterium]
MTGSGKIAALSRRGTLLALLALLCAPAAIAAEPLRIVALGDSLTAGLGLADGEAFPVKLQAALRKRGHNIEVINAGVSGDTASGGLARLDWSVPDGAAAVILELGANDALRGVDPAVTRKALEAMIRRLKERKIPVLLAGMQAPRNLGPDYAAAFDRIYPELAQAHDLIFFPFFLEGVATDQKLNQGDGIHPNAAGVDVIVARILPAVEALIARAKKA